MARKSAFRTVWDNSIKVHGGDNFFKLMSPFATYREMKEKGIAEKYINLETASTWETLKHMCIDAEGVFKKEVFEYEKKWKINGSKNIRS